MSRIIGLAVALASASWICGCDSGTQGQPVDGASVDGGGGAPDTGGDAGFDAAADAPDTAELPADVPALPDPGFIHAVRDPTEKVKDDPYAEDYATLYRTTDKLPDLQVRAMAVIQDVPWVATPSGLYSYSPGDDAFAPVQLQGAGAVSLAAGKGAKTLVLVLRSVTLPRWMSGR